MTTRKRLTDEEKIAALQAKIKRKTMASSAKINAEAAVANFRAKRYADASGFARAFADACERLANESEVGHD